MALVSTGQITIIDQNDARSITAMLTSNRSPNQVFTKDESSITYTPDYFTATTLILTPSISIGGLTNAEAWARLTNRHFSFTQGGAYLDGTTAPGTFLNTTLGVVTNPFAIANMTNNTSTASTLTIAGNLIDTAGSQAFYFDADYVDAATGLTTHLTCNTVLTVLKTGTNAVFITMRGRDAIEKSDNAVKSGTSISADLIRASAIADITNLTYKWYELSMINGTPTQISTTTPAGVATKYGIKSVATNLPIWAIGDLNVGLPTVGNGTVGTTAATGNTLSISETAVVDMQNYRVDITDGEGKTYQQYFVIYDLQDPYDVKINSTTGDKIINGSGSTTLSPQVFCGNSEVTLDSAWTFAWTITDKTGLAAGFCDNNKIPVSTGFAITSNTGNSFTIVGTPTMAGGNLIKCVKANGDPVYFEVATSAANLVTVTGIACTGSNSGFTLVNNPAPVTGVFNGGKMFGCTTGGVLATTGAATISVSAADIDVKNRIFCAASLA